MRNLLNIRL